MPNLYILVGPSGCGKSTWAHNFLKEHEDIRYVSRDDIRFSLLDDNDDYFAHERDVFRRFAGTIAQTMVDGFDIIADATHLNEFSRKKLTECVDNVIYEYNIIYVVFHTTYSICLLNDATREGIRHVGEKVIQGMFRTFKAPTLEEDPRAIKIIEVGEKKEDFSYLKVPYLKENEDE